MTKTEDVNAKPPKTKPVAEAKQGPHSDPVTSTMGAHSRSRRLLDRCRRSYTYTPPSSPSHRPHRRQSRYLNLNRPSLSHTNRTTTTPVCLNSCSSTVLWLKLAFSSISVAGVPTNSDMREKSSNVLKQRLELQHEVEELQRTLEREEKVHQVLSNAFEPNNETALDIPTFVPEKTRELLQELMIVEGEIVRLESDIRIIQKETQSRKSEQHEYSSPTMVQAKAAKPPKMTSREGTPENNTKPAEKVLMETKPMFFINQAIKGDYGLHGFSKKLELELGNSEDGADVKKSNKKVHERQGKISGRSRPLFSSSPQLPPKPSIYNHIEREHSRSTSISDEMLFNLSTPEKSPKSGQPNKLSEKIMKCLICIYLRLMRTSRKLEHDRTSTLDSRSTSATPLGPKILRGDANNLSLADPKDLKQQDPYGVFKIEGSLVRDIGHYKNLVICSSSCLDVKAMSTCVPLMRSLRVLLNSLRNVDLRFLTHQQKLAFWINMYNTTIMHGFLENGLPSDSDKVFALRNKAVLNIGGNQLNALAIEHFILRQASDMKDVHWTGEKDDKENAVRSIYGLDHPEPNITFALCSANKSSPAVRIYTAENVSGELEKAKLEYLQATIAVIGTEKLMIPKLLSENANDFAKNLESLVVWISKQLPTSGSLRKSMMACLRDANVEHTSDVVDIIPYELDFQLLLPI